MESEAGRWWGIPLGSTGGNKGLGCPPSGPSSQIGVLLGSLWLPSETSGWSCLGVDGFGGTALEAALCAQANKLRSALCLLLPFVSTDAASTAPGAIITCPCSSCLLLPAPGERA